MFAKLFEPEPGNQILVKFDESEDGGPEVRVFIKPEGLGVCSTAYCWEDSDEGWNLAKEAFVAFDEAMAKETRTNLINSLGGLVA